MAPIHLLPACFCLASHPEARLQKASAIHFIEKMFKQSTNLPLTVPFPPSFQLHLSNLPTPF